MEIKHVYNQDLDNLKIELSFDHFELLSLRHVLCGIKGIVDWYKLGPSQEKIGNSKGLFLSEGSKKLRDDPLLKSMPVQEKDLMDFIASHASYKDVEKQFRERLEACIAALAKVESDLLQPDLDKEIEHRLRIGKANLESEIKERKEKLGD